MDAAVRTWAETVSKACPEVRAVGYFGSYARGNWGVGSDVDLAVLVDRSDEPFDRRGLRYDASILPVPADILVYTVGEWESLKRERGFLRQADREMVWVLRQTEEANVECRTPRYALRRRRRFGGHSRQADNDE